MADDWKWLESTRELQEQSFGINFDELIGDRLASYVTWNHSALIIELSEFMAEIQWKPWAEPRGGVNRVLAVKELIDAAHFLGNLACALGVTDEEWERHYRAKQEINARRQTEGYDGVTGKCPACKRSLDDAQPVEMDGMLFCSGCGKRLEAE